MDPISWPYFRFIGMFVVGLRKAVGLTIDIAVSTEINVAVGFFGLSL